MLARTGGAALAQDVNGLWATHLGDGRHVTVLGHSYGSTTVADAFALGGMHANDAVLLGCPEPTWPAAPPAFTWTAAACTWETPPPTQSACSGSWMASATM